MSRFLRFTVYIGTGNVTKFDSLYGSHDVGYDRIT